MADHKFKDTAIRLLETVGVTVNGPQPWDIQVYDDRFYARVFAEGSLGFGEAYMDGWWDSGDLDETMTRILGSDIQSHLPRNLKTLKLGLLAKWTNRQNKRRAWIVRRPALQLGQRPVRGDIRLAAHGQLRLLEGHRPYDGLGAGPRRSAGREARPDLPQDRPARGPVRLRHRLWLGRLHGLRGGEIRRPLHRGDDFA